MRQAVLRGPRQLLLEDAPRPKAGPGDLLVEVKAVAICGTDVQIYSGQTRVSFPLVPGHEGAGLVREMGEGVVGFSPGDPVVLNPNVSCNRCSLCIAGRENLCPYGGFMGREVDGVVREHLAVPQALAFRLPPDLPLCEGALVQPLSTVVHSQRLAQLRPAESVVVLGAGASGLMHVKLAKLAGAFPVIAVGRSRWKLELAEQMGADRALQADREGLVDQVKGLTDGLGADVVIEAVGSPDTVQQALEMIRPGGRVLVYGISPSPLPLLDLYRLYRKEAVVVFPRAMTRADFQVAIGLMASKRVDLKPLISRQYPLEEAGAAFHFAEAERAQALRVAIEL
ncbi:MAG: alcohol dehydrogenase catalytic domain-containing protein [Chloroflexi bacterium]|nr:alcohol dehydrogenase catalytic domain-containing protein [Chloroflexota bacterium]